MSSAGKSMMGVAAVLVLAAFFIYLQGRDDDEGVTVTPTEPTSEVPANQGDVGKGKEKVKPKAPVPDVPVIEVRGGQPVGAVEELSFKSGSQIQFVVKADAPDEAHLHGYDTSMPVGPGKEARFDVEATIEGVFELELEESAVPIGEISVVP